MRKGLFASLALVVLVIAATSAAQGTAPMRWVTVFRGPSMCLDVVNGGAQDRLAHLAPCSAASGQLWTTHAIAGGWTTFTGEFRGPSMCLDIVNGGPLDGHAILEPCGAATGQHWHVTPSAGGGSHLTTEFRGESMCLDIVNGGPLDGFAHLTPCGTYSGQAWMTASR